MKELNRSFDQKTAKKLLDEYGDKIIYYMKENQSLRSQLEEIKITLDINKEMLYNYICKRSTKQTNDILLQLQMENTRINQLSTSLRNELNSKEKSLYQIEQQLNLKSYKYQILLEEKKESVFLLENKVNEKENIIKQLRTELSNHEKLNINQQKREIHIIIDPTQGNVELNQELALSRKMIVRYSHMINQATKKEKEQAAEIKELNNAIINIKKGRKIMKNIETIETFGYLITEDSNDMEDIKDDDTDITKQNNPSHLNEENNGLFGFPIKQKQLNTEAICHHKRNKSAVIPKLDLSVIISKYTPINKNEIKVNNKQSSNSDDEYIDKLKYQLASRQVFIVKYRKKIAKLKKIICFLKNLYTTLKTANPQSSSGGSTSDDKKSNPFTTKEINLNDSIVYQFY